MGHESELYALTIDDDLRDDVRPFSDPAATQGRLTIFHYALPSPMTEAFASLGSGRVLQYHNVTPASYFAPYDPALFRLAALGRDELAHPGRPRRSGARRFRIQPAGARVARVLAAPASFRLPSTPRGSPSRPNGRRSTRSSTTGW